MTPSWRSREEDWSTGLQGMPAADPDVNASRADAAQSTPPAQARIVQQIPAFAAVGIIGYFVDAGVTYVGAKYAGLPPELARPPGFLIATVINFLLNRSITFRHSRAPILRAFLRYSGVASVGLAINYTVYSACVLLAPKFQIVVTPAILPLFVAAGCAAAMVLTFVGFRFFAFRS
jgi:putative flippase GtrA